MIHISVRYSKPLENYRRDLLLILQSCRDIEQLDEVTRAAQRHRLRSRYNEIAIRDAELIILRALSESSDTKSSFHTIRQKTESTFPRPRSSASILQTYEREILEDCDGQNSSFLFEQARVEGAKSLL